MTDIRNNKLRKTSLPRTGRELDAVSASSVIGFGGNLDPSNIKPSSLWYPDKLKEYLRLNDDRTITILENGLEAKGSVKATGAVTAYATSDATFPIASTTQFGLTRFSADQFIVTNGIVSLKDSGGVNFTTGPGLNLSADKVLSVKFGTVAGTALEGNATANNSSMLGGQTLAQVLASNVASATKLQNARSINGTAFDGTANITTNTWGTARNFSIASHDMSGEGTAVSVNGFSAYVLPLPSTIKATLNGNAATATLAVSATKLQTARTLWGRPFDGTGNVTGGLSTVSGISMNNNSSILFADTGGVNRTAIGFNTSNALLFGHGTSLAGYNTSLYGNNIYFLYGTGHSNGMVLTSAGRVGIGTTSPLSKFHVSGDSRMDGTLLVTSNITSNANITAVGAVTAYATSDASFPLASASQYGLVKAGSGITVTNGVFSVDGGGGFGDITFLGSGAFLSDVSASADKKTLTFTRVGKPTYNVSEITNAVSTTDSRLTNARPASDVYAWAKAATKPAYTAAEVGAVSKNGDTVNGSIAANGSFYTNTGNFVSRIVGVTGGWERGFMWDDLNSTKTYGSVTMFGNNAVPSYISMGFGAYNDARRIRIDADGKVGIGYGGSYILTHTFNVNGNAKVGQISLYGGNEINCDIDLYLNYRTGGNIITNVGGGYLESRGRIYAKAGITSYSVNPNMSWDGWHLYNHPFKAETITVNQGAYYPVLTWSSVMPNGYIQWSSIGSLRDNNFGKVVITVGSSDNNSTASKYYFGNDGRLEVPTYIVSSDGWFQNNASSTGLYNSAEDARWYAISKLWRADRPIVSTGFIQAYGYLYSEANGKTLQMGSQNASYCHFETTAPMFYFNKRIDISGDILPYIDGIYYLGAESKKWGVIYGVNIYASSWLRSTGDTGWFNDKWSGGIYMNDSLWVKVYNKAFMCPYANPFGPSSFNVNLVIGASSNLHSGMEFTASNKIFGMGVHQNGNVYLWGGTSSYADGTSGKAYIGDINLVNNQFSWYGTIKATGAVTAYATNISDMRRKDFVRLYDLDVNKLLRLKTFIYKGKYDTDGLELVGISAQQLRHIASPFVMDMEDDRGKFYTFDYGRFGAIGVIKLAQDLLPRMDSVETRVEALERENRELREVINKLKAA